MFANLRAADIPTVIKAQDLRNELLLFSEDSICGPALGKDDITTIPVNSCANNLSDLLAAPGVCGKRKVDICKLAKLKSFLTVAVLSCPAKNR